MGRAAPKRLVKQMKGTVFEDPSGESVLWGGGVGCASATKLR